MTHKWGKAQEIYQTETKNISFNDEGGYWIESRTERAKVAWHSQKMQLIQIHKNWFYVHSWYCKPISIQIFSGSWQFTFAKYIIGITRKLYVYILYEKVYNI